MEMIDVESIRGRWVVVSYRQDDELVVPLEVAETSVTVDGSRISGTMGLNRFTGQIGDDLPIGPLATTRMAGPEDLMRQEDALLENLQTADALEVSGEGMIVSKDGLALIELRKVGNLGA